MKAKRTLTAVVGLTAIILLTQACAGWGFGISAMFRSSADYAALDAAREQARAEGAWTLVGPISWPQYRGPTRAGVVDGAGLALDWPEEGPPLAWSAPVGPAYSSVVVGGGLVVTIEQRREQEMVLAFSLEDGQLIWEHGWEARHYDFLSKEGPRATPAIGGDRVLALGATGELRALDLASGSLLWRASVNDAEHDSLQYGLAASPIVEGEIAFVVGNHSVYAIGVAHGEVRWESLAEEMAYATPVIAELAGVPTLIACTATRVVGLDRRSGDELWSFPWKLSGGGSTCTQPVALDEHSVLVSAGYGKGAMRMSITSAEQGFEVSMDWRSSRLKARYNEMIRRGEIVYGLDEGRLVAFDATRGQRLWKGESYGYGQLLDLGDRLLVVDGDGEVHLLTVDAEGAEELASFEALSAGWSQNLPALAQGRLLLRNDRELVCFDLRSSLRTR